jgi:hypothetical protein
MWEIEPLVGHNAKYGYYFNFIYKELLMEMPFKMGGGGYM